MTAQKKNRDARRPEATAEEVADYLRNHHDFFEQHEDLLQDLRLPHAVHGAVSLIEHQVTRFREQNRELQKQLQELIGIARDNDRLFSRLHKLTLALIEAEGLEAALAAVYDQLRQSFTADMVAVRLISPEAAERPEYVAPERSAALKPVLEKDKPACGRFSTEQLRVIFGERAEEVKSAALVPLGTARNRLGLLSVASFDADHFNAAMSTLFLTYMGETVTQVLRRHL